MEFILLAITVVIVICTFVYVTRTLPPAEETSAVLSTALFSLVDEEDAIHAENMRDILLKKKKK